MEAVPESLVTTSGSSELADELIRPMSSPPRMPTPPLSHNSPASSNAVLERPPVSPITPTGDSPPPAWPQQSALQETMPSSDAPHNRPHPGSFGTFTSQDQALSPRQSRSQASNSDAEISAVHNDRPALLPSLGAVDAVRPPASRMHGASFIPQPPSEPIDESSNADVAALKACISVLQLQKEKSRRDIMALQQTRDAAVADPTGFVTDLQSGKLNDGEPAFNPLAPSFKAVNDYHSDDDGQSGPEGAGSRSTAIDCSQSKFGTIPRPQNVARCPPINWAKYHVVGDSLDRMHEEQRRKPDPGEPWRQLPRGEGVLAPYSPFRDHVGSQASSTARKGGKKPLS